MYFFLTSKLQTVDFTRDVERASTDASMLTYHIWRSSFCYEMKALYIIQVYSVSLIIIFWVIWLINFINLASLFHLILKIAWNSQRTFCLASREQNTHMNASCLCGWLSCFRASEIHVRSTEESWIPVWGKNKQKVNTLDFVWLCTDNLPVLDKTFIGGLSVQYL